MHVRDLRLPASPSIISEMAFSQERDCWEIKKGLLAKNVIAERSKQMGYSKVADLPHTQTYAHRLQAFEYPIYGQEWQQ